MRAAEEKGACEQQCTDDRKKEDKDARALAHLVHSVAKVEPVGVVLDDKTDEHARVETGQRHLADFVAVVRGPDRVGVSRKEEMIDLVGRFGARVPPIAGRIPIDRCCRRRRRYPPRSSYGHVREGFDQLRIRRQDERDSRTREVGIDVEQRVGLDADEIVRRDRTTAGDSDRLREAEHALRGTAASGSPHPLRVHDLSCSNGSP